MLVSVAYTMGLLMRIVQKPWGQEEIFAETPHYLGKILTINPGHRLSRQYHNVKEETFRVLAGYLVLEIGAGNEMEEYGLGPGKTYHCPPGTIHRLICHESEVLPVQVIEVSTNPIGETEDIVRLEDDYKR